MTPRKDAPPESALTVKLICDRVVPPNALTGREQTIDKVTA